MSKKLRYALVATVALAALSAAPMSAAEGEEIVLEPAGTITSSGSLVFTVGEFRIECTAESSGVLNEGPIATEGVLGSVESIGLSGCTGGEARVLRRSRLERLRPLVRIQERRVILTGLLYVYAEAEFLVAIPIPGAGVMKCLYKGRYGVLVRVRDGRYGTEEGLGDSVPVFDDSLNPLRGRHDCTEPATVSVRLSIEPEQNATLT